MTLVFDIFQGIGIAAAVGVRPFLPGLVAGAMAAGDVELSFDHTHFHFLQAPWFLLVMLVGVVVVGGVERALVGRDRAPDGRGGLVVLAACAVVVGALFGAGAVARSHHPYWIGIVIGVVCALIGAAATQPLLGRVRGRLDAEAGGLLPVLTDGAAAVVCALSIVAPPVGIVLVAALLWLLVAGRGKGERKYAGLRVLR